MNHNNHGSGGGIANYYASGGNYQKGGGPGGGGNAARDIRREREQERKLSPTFKTALIFSMVAMVCLVIAFASPHWLVHDKRFSQYQMRNLGLWEVCFKGFRHPHQTFDKVYNGCWWVFSRYYDELLDYIEKGFFIAVQVFMSLGFLLFFIAMAMLIPVFLRIFDIDTEISVTLVMSGIMLLSCLSNFIGLCIFSAHGDDRNWMIDAQWSVYAWAFYLAWLSLVAESVAGILFLSEGRWKSQRRNRELALSIQYAMSISSSSPIKKKKVGTEYYWKGRGEVEEIIKEGGQVDGRRVEDNNNNKHIKETAPPERNSRPYYNYGNDIEKTEVEFINRSSTRNASFPASLTTNINSNENNNINNNFSSDSSSTRNDPSTSTTITINNDTTNNNNNNNNRISAIFVFFHFMGLVIFAFRGKDSDWMPHWKWNYYSWSYGFGVIGTLIQLISAILFLIDCTGRRKYVYQRKKENIQFDLARKIQG